MGKAIWEYPIDVRRRFPIGDAYSHTVKKGYSHLYMWTTSNWLARYKSIWEKRRHSSIMQIWNVLKDSAKYADVFLTLTEPYPNPVFSQAQRKNYQFWKIHIYVVLRHGRSWKIACGTILRIGGQNHWTIIQSINSMHWWPTIQSRRIEIRLRIVRSMFTNCSEISISGTNW